MLGSEAKEIIPTVFLISMQMFKLDTRKLLGTSRQNASSSQGMSTGPDFQ